MEITWKQKQYIEIEKSTNLFPILCKIVSDYFREQYMYYYTSHNDIYIFILSDEDWNDLENMLKVIEYKFSFDSVIPKINTYSNYKNIYSDFKNTKIYKDWSAIENFRKMPFNNNKEDEYLTFGNNQFSEIKKSLIDHLHYNGMIYQLGTPLCSEFSSILFNLMIKLYDYKSAFMEAKILYNLYITPPSNDQQIIFSNFGKFCNKYKECIKYLRKIYIPILEIQDMIQYIIDKYDNTNAFQDNTISLL
jgi:hypothetical protein